MPELHLARQLLVHGHHGPAAHNARPADAGDALELLPVPPHVVDIPAQRATFPATVMQRPHGVSSIHTHGLAERRAALRDTQATAKHPGAGFQSKHRRILCILRKHGNAPGMTGRREGPPHMNLQGQERNQCKAIPGACNSHPDFGSHLRTIKY